MRIGGDPMPDEELLTVEQAIERLGVSPATFWNLVKRYKLPKYKLPLSGKRVYFKVSDLEELKRPRRVNGEGKARAA
jgi:excisionase family DNA binding protein